MKRTQLLLLLMMLLGCGLIASAQKEWDGLLTTVEHPTDSAQGRVLAIMTDDAYIPIQIKEGVYATVANPQSNTQTDRKSVV